ncbi:MAG TPA: helicase-related protein [Thermoanaerobaculia bacterium]|nr:helicase-related protein [Thermoanaerobaculia bacterium]
MIVLAPHQLAAVDRILELFRRYRGAVLADETGLGKSFIAAEIARRMPRSDIEVIVPAPLVAQWRGTLAEFGAPARARTHESLLAEPFVPRPPGDRLLIVDEAHAFRNPATQRYAALARRSIGARLLLVTATPVCNSPDDLHALLALIVPDDALRPDGVASLEGAFRSRDAEAMRIAISRLIIRRGRDVLPDGLRFGSIGRRVIRYPLPDLGGIDELRFPLTDDGVQCELLRRLLWRRLESSEAALLESVRRQARFYERALDCLRSGRRLSRSDYRRAFAAGDDREAFQEVLFWEVFAREPARIGADEIRAEMHRLDALRGSAAAAPNVKRALLTAALKAAKEPALVFTGAVATARELAASLPRAALITSREARPSDAMAAFQRGSADVLVCTDIAAEGLNFQRAGVVVHYDIPWNPVKLDQRNGRAWRIGQPRAAVLAIYFLPTHRRTGIVETIAAKNRVRRRLLESGAAVAKRSSVMALPPHLRRDAPAVALVRTLQSRGFRPPPEVARRYRAGIERLFAEMARERPDRARLEALVTLLREEELRPV